MTKDEVVELLQSKLDKSELAEDVLQRIRDLPNDLPLPVVGVGPSGEVSLRWAAVDRHFQLTVKPGFVVMDWNKGGGDAGSIDIAAWAAGSEDITFRHIRDCLSGGGNPIKYRPKFN
jgi:hypothetical protein